MTRKKATHFELYELDADTVCRALKIAYEAGRLSTAALVAEATDYALLYRAIRKVFPNAGGAE